MGASRFDPWGTELFMRNDMPDILAYADRIGFREIYVVSNGLLLNRPGCSTIWQLLKVWSLLFPSMAPKLSMMNYEEMACLTRPLHLSGNLDERE